MQCKCGCGEDVSWGEYKRGHWAKAHRKWTYRPLCACGCGEQVKRPQALYLSGHASRRPKLCACGCGETIAVGGNIRRYLSGHNVRRIDDLDIDPLDKAWAAGFIDGEGSFQIRLRENTSHAPHLTITVGQTILEPLEKLKEMFGGSILLRKSEGERSKACHVWTVTTRLAAQVCHALAPYLVVKKKQAELGVKFYLSLRPMGVSGRLPLTKEENISRCEYAIEMLRLNNSPRASSKRRIKTLEQTLAALKD